MVADQLYKQLNRLLVRRNVLVIDGRPNLNKTIPWYHEETTLRKQNCFEVNKYGQGIYEWLNTFLITRFCVISFGRVSWASKLKCTAFVFPSRLWQTMVSKKKRNSNKVRTRKRKSWKPQSSESNDFHRYIWHLAYSRYTWPHHLQQTCPWPQSRPVCIPGQTIKMTTNLAEK